MNEKMKKVGYAVATGVTSAVLPFISFADGESGGLTAVSTAITKAGSDVVTAAGPIVTSAVGVGIVFWGAKVIWRKFKEIAG